MEKFKETMPTIIRTHLIIEPNRAEVTKKAKNLKHIIQRCDPPAIAPPIIPGAGAVPSLYSHIAQSQDEDSGNISEPFKSTKSRGVRNQVKANQNLNSSLNHLPLPQKKNIKRQIIITIMRIIEVITKATNPTGVNKMALD